MSRHSSRTYATPLRLEPAGSRTLWRLIPLLHLPGLAVIPATAIPAPAIAVLYAGLAVSCAVMWWRLARHGSGALRRLTWQAGHDCQVELRGGRVLEARLEPRAFVHPRLVILYYRRGTGRVRSLALLPDMIDAVTWRRLRVRLNTQLQVADEDADRDPA